jgi:hypothetical protein
VLHQLGAGVLGPVFRAHDPDAERLVAIKLFQLDFTPEQARDLARALDALCDRLPRHPALVAPLMAGLEGSTAYLATECVAADSLDARLRRRVTGGFRQSLPVLRQVAEAIDAAWGAGLRHGALHPRDILVTTTGATQVTGFGIAEAVEAAGGRAPLRRPYAAPERVAREVWDTRADIYSLGVMATELLAGRRPGSGAAPSALTDLLVQSEGLDSEACRRALARALAESPGSRWQTAREFAVALEAAVLDEDMAEPWDVAPARAGHGERVSPAAVTLPPVIVRPGEAGADAEPPARDMDLTPPEPSEEPDPDLAFRRAPEDDQPQDLLLEAPAAEELREPEELFAGPTARAEDEERVAGAGGRAIEHDEDEQDRAAGTPSPAGAAEDPGADRGGELEVGASGAREGARADRVEDEDEAREYEDDDPALGDADLVEAEYVEDARDLPAIAPDRGEPRHFAFGRQPEGAEGSFDFEGEAEGDRAPDDEARGISVETGPPLPAALPASRPPRTFLSAEPLGERHSPLHLAALVLLGLVVGLLAGYAIWGRSAPVPPAQDATLAPGEADPGGTEQVYSEEPLDETGAPARVDGAAAPAVPAGRPGTAPAAAQAGRLTVQSTPAGADVSVNGQPRGQTPLALDLPLGRYKVAVSRAGHRTESREVTISSARPTPTMSVRLPPEATREPAPVAREAEATGQGRLEIVSRPAGARVTIDGRQVGVTPVQTSVQAGARAVRLELDGYAPWSTTVRIEPGRPARVGASLELRR